LRIEPGSKPNEQILKKRPPQLSKNISLKRPKQPNPLAHIHSMQLLGLKATLPVRTITDDFLPSVYISMSLK